MTKIQKQYKKLIKYYNKELQRLHKVNFNNLNNNLDYFGTYLRFMRDLSVLHEFDLDNSNNLKISSLCLAVSELENYYNCFQNYFKLVNGIPQRIDTSKSETEVQALFAEERAYHWTLFWQTVQLNMESWFEDNEFKV